MLFILSEDKVSIWNPKPGAVVRDADSFADKAVAVAGALDETIEELQESATPGLHSAAKVVGQILLRANASRFSHIDVFHMGTDDISYRVQLQLPDVADLKGRGVGGMFA